MKGGCQEKTTLVPAAAKYFFATKSLKVTLRLSRAAAPDARSRSQRRFTNSSAK